MKPTLGDYRKNRYRNYVKLADAVPLQTPFTVLIDPVNACNFKCVFCPTGDPELLDAVGRPKGLMGLDLFCKIIDDIGTFDSRLRKLQLYKDGEPLLNKRLPEMVSYAKEKRVSEIVETTTNAALLTGDLAAALLDARLDAIRISVEHVTAEGYKDVTRNFSDYDAIRSKVEALFNLKEKRNSPLKVHAKIIDIGLSEEEKEKFIADFSPISDSLNIDTLMDWGGADRHGRDFQLGRSPSRSIDGVVPLNKQRKVCSSPFKSLAVNFDGRVSVCCVDWSLETIVGDVSKTSLRHIWEGGDLLAFRMTHLEGRRDTLKACAGCRYMMGFSDFEDLDPVAEDLAKKLRNKP